MLSFFDGGYSFNLTTFVVNLIGLAIAILALWIAIVQLRKIRVAAVAARKAAEESRFRLMHVTAHADLIEMSRLAEEIHTHLMTNNVSAASIRTGDLRRSIAYGRKAYQEIEGIKAKEWQGLLTDVADVHVALIGSQSEENNTKVNLMDVRRRIQNVNESLVGYSAVAGLTLGKAN